MISTSDVVIVGGGLAGLCAAIHLRKFNHQVTLIEKNRYPNHKVCGEYISNEVLPYLNYLGFNPFDYGATNITRLEISQENGQSLETKLSLGGFGLSRFSLDNQLYKLALKNNVKVVIDRVLAVAFTGDKAQVKTKTKGIYKAKIAIVASGKRSLVDKALNRDFVTKHAPYLAVKWHAEGNFPMDLVGLHNFKGGYCGVSRVENNRINFCFIAHYNAFKKYKSIPLFIQEELHANPKLSGILNSSHSLIPGPLSISQISFSQKPLIENHAFMCGDAAGLIHPLCGNGMSMAMHAAKIATETIHEFLIDKLNRTQAEARYQKQWKNNFNSRLSMGRKAAYIFKNQTAMQASWQLIKAFPSLLDWTINQTHGSPIKINS